jgi:hypothetical protein
LNGGVRDDQLGENILFPPSVRQEQRGEKKPMSDFLSHAAPDVQRLMGGWLTVLEIARLRSASKGQQIVSQSMALELSYACLRDPTRATLLQVANSRQKKLRALSLLQDLARSEDMMRLLQDITTYAHLFRQLEVLDLTMGRAWTWATDRFFRTHPDKMLPRLVSFAWSGREEAHEHLEAFSVESIIQFLTRRKGVLQHFVMRNQSRAWIHMSPAFAAACNALVSLRFVLMSPEQTIGTESFPHMRYLEMYSAASATPVHPLAATFPVLEILSISGRNLFRRMTPDEPTAPLLPATLRVLVINNTQLLNERSCTLRELSRLLHPTQSHLEVLHCVNGLRVVPSHGVDNDEYLLYDAVTDTDILPLSHKRRRGDGDDDDDTNTTTLSAKVSRNANRASASSTFAHQVEHDSEDYPLLLSPQERKAFAHLHTVCFELCGQNDEEEEENPEQLLRILFSLPALHTLQITTPTLRRYRTSIERRHQEQVAKYQRAAKVWQLALNRCRVPSTLRVFRSDVLVLSSQKSNRGCKTLAVAAVAAAAHIKIVKPLSCLEIEGREATQRGLSVWNPCVLARAEQYEGDGRIVQYA